MSRSEPLEHRIARSLELDNARHEVLPDGDWVKWVQREFKVPEVFLYYHKETKNVVLAEWIEKPRLCLELWAFEVSPTQVPPSPDWLRDLLRPSTFHAGRVKEGILRKRREEREAKQASREEQAMRANHLWRRGEHEAAISVAAMGSNYIGEVEGGEEQEQLKRELKGWASKKTVG